MAVFSAGWQYPPKVLILPKGTAHLWRFKLDLPLEAVAALRNNLSSDELLRAKRLLSAEKQKQFIVGRSCLRTILGRYLDKDPGSLRFSYGQRGKPALQGEPDTLYFNLAHSHHWAVLAVTRAGQIGVDIEQIDFNLNFHQLAENYFSPHELSTLTATSEHRQRRMFYRLWTLKESRLKLTGSGFSCAAEQRQPHTSLHCALLPVARNYLAAVACSTDIVIARYCL